MCVWRRCIAYRCKENAQCRRRATVWYPFVIGDCDDDVSYEQRPQQ